jgi:hypothetical protein
MGQARKLHFKKINSSVETHVGNKGDMFYDPATPALRVSNGLDAGGVTGVVQVTRVTADDDEYEYTLLPSDHFVIVNPVTYQGTTIYLPQTAVDGKQYIIKRDAFNADTYHSIHMQPGGETTIEGDSGYTREWGNSVWTFTFDADQGIWYITAYTSKDPG